MGRRSSLPNLRGIIAAVAAALPLIFNSAADVQAAAGPISLVITSEPGGGEDQYGRLVAQWLQQELPGHPPIIPRTMTGASGVLALNWAFNSAPRDGSVILTTQGPSILAPLQGVQGAHYDPRTFGWLGSVDRLTNVLTVWHTSSVQTLEQVFTSGMTLGNGSMDTAVIPAMLNRVIGTKFKIIAGYPGTDAVSLAMERGEVDGTENLDWGSLRAMRADWLTDKKIRILMQVTFHPAADLPTVPSLLDFVKSPDDRAMLEVLLAKQDIGRPFLTPPGEPTSVIATQQAAFSRMLKNPDFIKAAGNMKLAVDPTPGPELEALVKQIYGTPQSTLDRLRGEMELARAAVGKK